MRTCFHLEKSHTRRNIDMRISHNTVAVLRNFAKINDGLVFQKGNTLRTVDPSKQMLAEAILDNEFPQDGAIYSLKEFLSKIRLYTNPIELAFAAFESRLHLTVEVRGKDALSRMSSYLSPTGVSLLPLRDMVDDLMNLNATVIGSAMSQSDNHGGGTRATGTITIQEEETDSRRSTVYMCDPGCITAPPSTRLQLGDAPLTFDLCAADLAWLKRTGNTQMTALTLSFDGKTIRFRKMPNERQQRSSQEEGTGENIVVGTGEGTSFQFSLDMTLLKCLMPGSYSVQVKRPMQEEKSSIAHFLFKGFPLKYWFHLEGEKVSI